MDAQEIRTGFDSLKTRAACLLMENAVLLARIELIKLNWRAQRMTAGAL